MNCPYLDLSLGDHILRLALLPPPWVLSYLLTLPRITDTVEGRDPDQRCCCTGGALDG